MRSAPPEHPHCMHQDIRLAPTPFGSRLVVSAFANRAERGTIAQCGAVCRSWSLSQCRCARASRCVCVVVCARRRVPVCARVSPFLEAGRVASCFCQEGLAPVRHPFVGPSPSAKPCSTEGVLERLVSYTQGAIGTSQSVESSCRRNLVIGIGVSRGRRFRHIQWIWY